MARKKEELNAVKAEAMSLHERLAFITEEELMQLVGGSDDSTAAPEEGRAASSANSAVDEWWAARTQNKYKFD